MNILILGGTSFFGKDLVRMLHAEGHTVSIFTRGKIVPPDLPPVRHFKGDRKNLNDLKKTIVGTSWDVVVDNIAFTGEEVETALSVFRDCGRYVLTSTVSVYRYVKNHFPQPLREQDVDFDLVPENEDLTDVHWKYARGKLEAERACVRQNKVPYTIIRPPIIYGPNDVTDRGFWYLARLNDGEPIILANGGVNGFRLAYSVDVARSILQIIERPNTANKIYNVAQEEILTLKDFIDESARVLNRKPNYVSIPFEFLKAFGDELGGQFAFPSLWIQDITAARNDFGFQPTPFHKFGHSTAIWYRDNWRGDHGKLMQTREREIELAAQWAELTGELLPGA